MFPLIRSSHTLPAPQASGLQHTNDGVQEGWGASWGCVGASHRDTACSVNPGRDGSVARGGTATKRRVQWAGGWLRGEAEGGSLGAKVLHTVQFSATLSCSLRFYPPLRPNIGLVFMHEKQLLQCQGLAS